VALISRRSTRGLPGTRRGARPTEGAWLFGLLALLVVLPAVCILWLLTQAVATEGAAARQQILEAYRGQLRLGRSRVDAHWREFAGDLQRAETPARQFARLIVERDLSGEALHGRLTRHRIYTQMLGVVSIFVTALWGMYQNMSFGAL